jgi:RNA polymerase sigma-70 factor (ECF subfamily)
MAHEQAHPVLRFIRQIKALDDAESTADEQLLAHFVAQHDEAAFAALVQRHGPMVLGVCRRVLHHVHDAEDAYQATFLVLARKARSLSKPESLGNWLYGVAYRTALKAKAAAARRRARERESVALAVTDPVEEVIKREVRLVLDDELSRLPSKYRTPIVLCYLEGQTQEEAARTLGCPRKTVTTRLTRACARLRTRLLRRGATLSAGAFAAVLSQNAESAGLPLPPVDSTVQAATQFAAGKAAATRAVSAHAVALTKGVLTSMFVTKLKTMAVLLLTITVAGASVGVWTYRALAEGQGAARAEDQPKPAAEDATKAQDADKKTDKDKLQGTWVPVTVEFRGRKVSEQEIKDKNFEMIFTGDKVTIPTSQGDTQEVTYKLDPAKKPKHIDFLISKDEPSKAIYLLQGDTLKVCMPMKEGDERPTEFESKTGTSILLMELKKKPSPTAEDATKAQDADKKTDKEKLQGAWVPVAVVNGGRKISEDEIKDKNFEMVFTGDKVTIPAKDVTKQEVTYKLDPAKKPKHIDWMMPDNRLAKGIYLLDGDTLKVCVSEQEGAERPTEFESKEGSKILLMEFKRK